MAVNLKFSRDVFGFSLYAFYRSQETGKVSKTRTHSLIFVIIFL